MELFSSTGFAIGDRVFTLLDDRKYFGVVLKVDDRLKRIKVDYSAKGENAIDWFRTHFWQKV